jgi:peptidoglycan biosynthesis protein MviN/MurJ (putative lipid II flippase)
VSSLIVSGLTVASFIVGLPFGPAGVAISYSVSGVLIQMPVLFYIAGRRGPVAASDLWAGFWRFVPLWCIVGGATWLARGLVRESASLAQVVICAPVGLLAGAVFIWIYSPARQVAVTILDALRDWRKTRNRL